MELDSKESSNLVVSTATTEEVEASNEADLPVYTLDQPSSQSSTADEVSSIEALNWSDFEDDEPGGLDPSLLQSIHSQISNNSGNGEEQVLNMSVSASSNVTMIEPTVELKNILEKLPSTSLNLLELPKQKQGMKRKRDESPMVSSTLSIASSEFTGDLSSNAAVLDDGPIWAKGNKKYRFEENRHINQKLTFGVLLSVVLAVGLGLGNLVAYNECEAEHKANDLVPCPMSNPQDSVTTNNIPSPTVPEKVIQTAPPIQGFVSSDISSSEVPIPMIPSPPPIIREEFDSKITKPMIDPKYHQHVEELSRVLKMLDELSRKIDMFENTTRQLGGIVMMKDELPPRGPPTKKTKFLKLLADFMQTKKLKHKIKSGEENVKTWKEKKEEVLEEIAGAILEAMKDEDDEEIENEKVSLEEGQLFSVDDNLIEVDEKSIPYENLRGSNLNYLTEVPEPTGSVLSTIPDKYVTKSTGNVQINPDENILLKRKDKRNKHKELESKKQDQDRKQKTKSKPSHGKKLKRMDGIDFEDDDIRTKSSKKDYKHHPEDQKKKDQKHSKNGGKQEYTKKVIPEKSADWDSIRAEERENYRRAGVKQSNDLSKKKNWQLERDRVREEFRETRPIH